ncbi:hypothetical protein FNU76_17885 [Chitinimonas arctica]|uniref:Immunity protein 50 n=1 Tax=Chitinimonas arctica TaxID=2594795 RepID=A0A516SIT0_9NEIS|nr:Imm50 family immunity protein [Chitinimonas arctica]QDQ28065.1 hypothetical protein FNU76_17885 [Chitinimonas arctica]
MSLDFIDRADFLKGVYGAIPSFSEIVLHDIVLSDNGPSVALRFDLANFPSNPPKKWEEFNTVQVTLDLTGLRSISISKFGLNNRCSLKLVKDEDGVSLQSFGEVELSAIGDFIAVAKISAYLNDV